MPLCHFASYFPGLKKSIVRMWRNSYKVKSSCKQKVKEDRGTVELSQKKKVGPQRDELDNQKKLFNISGKPFQLA